MLVRTDLHVYSFSLCPRRSYIVFSRLFSTGPCHYIPNLVHAQNLGICQHVSVDSSWIHYDFSNILANIQHIGQGESHIAITHNPMINICRVRVIGPAGWDFGDPDLIPTAHVDNGVWQAVSLDHSENFEFLARLVHHFCRLCWRVQKGSQPTLSLISITPLGAGPTHSEGTKRFTPAVLAASMNGIWRWRCSHAMQEMRTSTSFSCSTSLSRGPFNSYPTI